MSRKPPTLREKLAAALLTMLRDDGTGKLVPIISFDDARKMTADQVISLFHFDHYPIPHAHGGTNHPSNLVPRLIAEHREKTAKVDQPMLAKTKRIQDREARITPEPRQKLKSRGFEKSRPQRSASRPIFRPSEQH